jgi:hypothetical protein
MWAVQNRLNVQLAREPENIYLTAKQKKTKPIDKERGQNLRAYQRSLAQHHRTPASSHIPNVDITRPRPPKRATTLSILLHHS